MLHSYDPSGHVINLGDGTRREVDQLTANVVNTIAGDGTAIFAGDGVAATKSGISTPQGIALGPDASVYFVDNAHRVIRVSPNGIQTTVAGTGVRGFSGDGGPANQAQLANPTSVALGLDGSVYIADRSNFRVRRVAPNGVISTFAGIGIMGAPDEGSLAKATQIFPRNVAVGPDGRLFISDAGHVWVVDQNGVINAYAGAGGGFSGDGGPRSRLARTQAAWHFPPMGRCSLSTTLAFAKSHPKESFPLSPGRAMARSTATAVPHSAPASTGPGM